MKISVTVKPNSKATEIVRIAASEYSARVCAPAMDGKANEAVIAALAERFRIPKSRVRLLHGTRSRKKIFDIL